MVTNVTSLLKTVKAVEDEATRGTRALEATIEYVKQELTVRATGGPLASCSSSSRVLVGVSRGDAASPDSGGVGDICACYSQENKDAFSFFCPPLLFYYLSGSFPPCQSLQGSRLLLSGSGEKMQAEQERQEDLCNLLFVI